MRKYLTIMVAVVALLTAACQKDGKLLNKPARGGQMITLSGFAVGDTVEQYFDGRKVREFSGRSFYVGRMVFDKEGPVVMQIKKKGDPTVLYTKSIELDSATSSKRVTFFYDGKKAEERYNYPDAEPNVEKIAFYFNFPANMPVDIVYGDISGDVNAVKYLKRNVQPKQWVDFITIPPIQGPDMYIFLLKAGTKEYLINNDFLLSYLQANLPTTEGWYQGGSVQSLHVNYNPNGGQATLITDDLVPVFPR